MIAIPLLLLALAAGIYLLIKASTQYLGPVFKILSWAVIVLSLVFIFALLAHGLHHFRGMHHRDGRMREERFIFRQSGDGNMGCPMNMNMSGCKVVGDSVEMDRAACEKLMGKDSCDKLFAQRGKCILSLDECTKLCGGNSKCMMMDNKGACCMKGGDGTMKECCKKK